MWNLFDKLWSFYEKDKKFEKTAKNTQAKLTKSDLELDLEVKNSQIRKSKTQTKLYLENKLENNLEEKLENKSKFAEFELEKTLEFAEGFEEEFKNNLKIENKNPQNGQSGEDLDRLEQKKLQNKEDVEIVRLILSGNKDLFEKILDNYQQQILIYCTRLLNWHAEDGKDATSSTFVKAYINLASFNPKLQFSSWLYRIAHNEAINKIKQNSKHWTLPIDKLIEKNGQNDNIFSKFLSQADQNSVSRITVFEENDKKFDLEMILDKLKTDDKNILLLFYIQELSLEQIGEILKITTNNAKVRLFRARDKAKKLAKNCKTKF